MSTATLKDLIAKQKQIIIQKNQDPNFNENQLMYAQKEQVVHKLINDQMNQIYKEKITIHDQLKSRLIKYKRDSRTILNGAESELHTEKQKRLSMPNSQPETFQQLLLVEKENKTSQLEDLIKKGMTITEKQRKQLIQIHEEFFANIDLKLNEIGGAIKRRRRSQSVDYINHNKLVRLGTKARQIKQLSDNGQILIEFIKDNDKTHQERAHLLKSLAEGKVQVQMRKSGSEDEVKPKICALKPINIITELPPLTKKCQHYWGYLPIKDQFTQPQLYDPSRIWSRYPGSKTTGTLLFPREGWWRCFFEDEGKETGISKWLGVDGTCGVIILCLKQVKVLPLKFKQYGEDGVLMLLRWKDGEIQEVVPKGYAFPADGKCTNKRATKIVASYLGCAINMFEMESNIGLEMRMFEDTLTPTKVTAGVIFSNNESNWRDIIDYQGYDDDFIEFLGYIGNGVDISNFTGFAGDLDISNDALDGIYSVYARKDCYELMYHVSPLLSEKKRGVLSQENVMIVFHKGDNEINVSSISLKTQVIVIVKPLESTNYKIEVWHKNNLKDIEIEMPSEEFVIPKQYLKEFIITVCINAEHIATVSGVFASTFSKEREKLLIQVKKQLFESMPRHSLSKSKAILPSI